MKRIAALLLSVLLLLYVSSALANSYGLSGPLYAKVVKDASWDDYTSKGDVSKHFAVVGTRYHHTLLALHGEELTDYTAAAWQPEDNREAPHLTEKGDSFTLSYGKTERYTFTRWETDWRLTEAKVNDLSFTANPKADYAALTIHAGGTSILWRELRLSEFNIRLFPRTIQEVRQLNVMYASLESGASLMPTPEFCYNNRYAKVGNGTVPVYSAPFGKAAWRAAKGKASVGLGGEMWLLDTYRDDNGETYACIRYAVSKRTHRIGWIRATYLNPKADAEWALPHTSHQPFMEPLRVTVHALRSTYLTDDPDVSQFRQFEVPEGTIFDCRALYGQQYAYVCAEVKDGRFTDGGAIVWGFVPLKDLGLGPDACREDIQWELMEQTLTGSWAFDAGGSMGAEQLRLNPDGTFVADGNTPGWYYVTRYDPQWKLYWNDPPYEMVMIYDDGRVNVKGLMLDEEGFSLTNSEGGGWYERVKHNNVDPNADHG